MAVNVTYGMAVPADYDEIINHANFVFSYAHCPHEFKTLIPKAYGENRTMYPEHFVAREDGRIRGLVGLLRFDQRVCDETLKLGFIGTVSVHPYSRGMGHMIKCMDMVDDYARENKLDMLILGGQRQRYEHYGFEQAGVVRRFECNKTNCRHALANVDISHISFVPFENIRERMAELHAVYEAGAVAGARPLEHFEQICGTWRNVPRAMLRDGAIIGYVISYPDNKGICEIRLTDEEDLPVVVKAFLNAFNLEEISIRVAPQQTGITRALSRLSEVGTTGIADMIKVYDYERVVYAYLSLKQRLEGALPDGEITLGIKGLADAGQVKALTISISHGTISCRFTERQPCAVYTTLEALNLLFAPICFSDMTKLPDCARRYFPLPFYVEESDGF